MKAQNSTQERTMEPFSGWPVLIFHLALIALYPTWAVNYRIADNPALLAGTLFPTLFAVVLILTGYYVVEPNMSRVMVLFGKYKGTVTRNGFFWTNPFTMKRKISLRAHNLDSDTIKVNDLLGNPIEISSVIVWRVAETARASFDVEDYEHYVHVQADAAVRQLATTHPYDNSSDTDETVTLRGNTDFVAEELEKELSGRLERAGIEVIEARLNHLAYAPEIASAMLQRQQAKAIVDARHLIVEGAVGMCDMALEQLGQKRVLELDDERRATLVSNLLVVLCGQAAPQPVVNTGSLYT